MNVSDILLEFADHGFSTPSTARLMAVLNDTYWDVCGRMKWPWLEGFATLTFNGTNDTASNLPADFHAVTSMTLNSTGAGSDPYTSGAGKIRWIRYDDFEERYGTITPFNANPFVFYFRAGVPHFYPVPSATNTVRLGYIKTPAALLSTDVEATILLPPQYHRSVLVNGALVKLYAMDDDQQTSQVFDQMYEANIQRMVEWMHRLQYQQVDVIHPMDPDDLGWQILGMGA